MTCDLKKLVLAISTVFLMLSCEKEKEEATIAVNFSFGKSTRNEITFYNQLKSVKKVWENSDTGQVRIFYFQYKPNTQFVISGQRDASTGYSLCWFEHGGIIYRDSVYGSGGIHCSITK
ncbi:MAG: hypothetical protein WC760_06515 [Bacteroidia bacterium]|jgi:hypothetical protein